MEIAKRLQRAQALHSEAVRKYKEAISLDTSRSRWDARFHLDSVRSYALHCRIFRRAIRDSGANNKRLS